MEALAVRSPSRVVGTHEGEQEGPTIVVTGALHGNEPAGIYAVEQVLDALHKGRIPFRGRLVAAIGNRAALQHRRRYLNRDLNRNWDPMLTTRLLKAQPAQLNAEDREQRDLLELFGPLLADARSPVVFLDLHSTSGDGAPFVCMADVIRNRKAAFNLNIPVVLGLEETIEGSMLGYLSNLGHIGIAVEGGQHDDPLTVEHHRAAIWSVLDSTGAIRLSDIPTTERGQDKLRKAVAGLPGVIEIRHRHVCTDDDGFVMRPDYRNFQPIRAGEIVADDNNGPIAAPERGIMMLPRYQGQGEDGYFIARPVRSMWLSLSARLRRLGADRVLKHLPGVVPHPDRPDHFLVAGGLKDYGAIEVFHLLGYRRCRPEGGRLVFSRRRPDAEGPEPLPLFNTTHRTRS